MLPVKPPLAALLSAWLLASLPQATIRTRSGTIVRGDILGSILFKRPMATPDTGVAYLLVEGSKVQSIDERGVKLAAGTEVRAFFVPGDGLGSDFAPLAGC